MYKEISGFSIDQLETCLIDIGIVENRSNNLIPDLQKRRMIANADHIPFEEFKNIFGKIMLRDP